MAEQVGIASLMDPLAPTSSTWLQGLTTVGSIITCVSRSHRCMPQMGEYHNALGTGLKAR